MLPWTIPYILKHGNNELFWKLVPKSSKRYVLPSKVNSISPISSLIEVYLIEAGISTRLVNSIYNTDGKF